MICVLFVLIRPTCPAGQQADRSFELNTYAGNLSVNSGSVQAIDVHPGREIRTELRNGIHFGARLIYQANSYLGLEANFGSSLNKYFVRLIVYQDEISTEETTYLGFLHGNILLQPFRGRLAPYLTCGVGIFAFIDSFVPAVNFGGGIKVPLSDRLSFRIDIRQYEARLKDTIQSTELVRDGPVLKATEISWPYENRFSFIELSAGLSFRLGRKIERQTYH